MKSCKAIIITGLLLINTGCSVSALIENLSSQGSTTVTTSESPLYDFEKMSVHAAALEKEVLFQNRTAQEITSLAASISFSPTSQATTPFAFKGGTFPGTGGDCGATVAANSECKIVLTYNPSIDQVDGGAVNFQYSLNGENQTLTLSLAGTGVDPAVLGISDGLTYDFGSVNVGSSSATKTFTVTNTGGQATAVMESTLAPPFAYEGGAFPGTGGDCAVTIAANDTCTLVVKYTPILSGLETGTLTLSYFDGLASQTTDRAVEGTGVIPNVAPVADDDAVNVVAETATAVTLSATDANGDTLTYTVVSNPTHGSLTGTAPNLTYTPDAGYVGADSFTFKANDGSVDSNTATVTITVVTPVIYLRTTGDDNTAIFNDPAQPFSTAQGAVNMALTKTTTMPIIIDVGSGSFGNVTLTSHLVHNITWRGVSRAASVIGNIIASGTAGSNGYDDNGTFYGGTSGTSGYNVTLKSQANVTFGNVDTRGGHGGDSCGCDPTTSAGGGGHGGNVNIGVDVVVGNIQVMGGNTGNFDPMQASGGGSGMSGTVTISGTAHNIDGTGASSASGGSSGASVTINSGATVTGKITVDAGSGGYGSAASAGTITVNAGATVNNLQSMGNSGYFGSSPGGTITVDGYVTGYIEVTGGGDGTSSANNTGGTVTVGATGVVDGLITSKSGESFMTGGTMTGGTVIIHGTAANIDVSGGNGSTDADDGGSVTVTGTVTGNITSMGGTSPSNCGAGGAVTISGTVAGTINVSAPTCDYPDRGGTVVVDAGGSVMDIYANGGTSPSLNAQSGGNVTVRSNGSSRDIYANGGTSSGSGPLSGGGGGTVVIEANATSGNISARGGDSADAVNGDGGSAGSVTVDGSALSYYAPTPITIDNAAGTP